MQDSTDTASNRQDGSAGIKERRALVCGAGGFIGGHLVNRLKQEGYHVTGVDLKENEFGNNRADEFIMGDLRDPEVVRRVVREDLDEIYQLAADMRSEERRVGKDGTEE